MLIARLRRHASQCVIASCWLLAGHAAAASDAAPKQNPDPPAGASTPAPPKEARDARDTIIVTGSRIPRRDLTEASPVATYDRGEITAFGSTVLEDFINTLPQIKPDLGKTSNNPGDGTSAVNLRGLGSGRSLVLLNGRRIAPTGTGSGIDINAIPGAMIERVELVSGGASAVYGSDAVTGAVNFITRKDFKGLEASAQADVFGAGDGQTYNGSIAGGFDFAQGRGYVALFGDFLKRKEVLQGDREFSAFTLNEVGGVLVASGSPTVPAGRTRSGGPSLVFNSDGTVRPFDAVADAYNFAPANYLQTPQERWSGGAFAEFDATDSLNLYTELIYSRPAASQQLAPPPNGSFTIPLVINAPFFPASTRSILAARYDRDGDGLGTVVFSKRFEDTGPRRFSTQRDYYRALIGFRADLGADVSLDGFYSYGRNDNTERLDNAVSRSRVLQGLRIDPATGQCVDPSNGCVPVNIFGAGNISPAAQEFIRVDGLANQYASVQHNAALIATGDVFDWSQGTVQASGGVEFRRNSASSQADPSLETGDALGFNPFAGAAGEVVLYEAFAEALVPLLDDKPFVKHLEIEIGGRFSHYSTAGSVWTWKAGGQWRVSDALRFSGMWQRAVRAPNVDELFTVAVTAFGELDGADDFCAAANDPVGRGLAPVCIAQGMSPAAIGVYNPPPGLGTLFFDTTSSGNPDLGVERAGSITAGLDYTFDLPVTLRIGADYFSITLDDAIARVGDGFATCALLADPASEVCGLIRRSPDGDPILYIDKPINVAVARTRGIDFTLDFGADVPEGLGLGDARLSIRSSASLYFEVSTQEVNGVPAIDCAGRYGRFCAFGFSGGNQTFDGLTFPGRLVSTAFSLEKERFSGSLRWRWISGQDNVQPLLDDLAGVPPAARDYFITSIPAKHYVDLAGAYELFEGVILRAGIDNLFKTRPPLLGDQAFQANTDPTRYDVFGRRFYAGVDVKLWGAR